MPPAIAALAADYLVDPVKIAVAPAATTAERVEQSVVFVPSERKREVLAHLLRDPRCERVLVFTRTKHGADRVVRHLASAGIDAAAIHGNKSQPQRERALAGFRSGNGRVLVATDIAARGIDVDGVSHVINFELPNVPEDYVHRIGRTARAGAAGIAIALCSDEERPYLRSIEKLTRQPVPPMAVPQMAVPQMAVPQMAVPQMAVPQMAVPQMAVPRMAASPAAPRVAREPAAPPSVAPRRNDVRTHDALPAFLRRHPVEAQPTPMPWRARRAKRTAAN
jgi:ATP-dependent RNA helicase RhlE